MLTESMFVPNTSEKLFRSNSAMWKRDPYSIAKVRGAWDVLSKCWSCKETPSRGSAAVCWGSSHWVPEGQGQELLLLFSVLAAHKENSYIEVHTCSRSAGRWVFNHFQVDSKQSVWSRKVHDTCGSWDSYGSCFHAVIFSFCSVLKIMRFNNLFPSLLSEPAWEREGMMTFHTWKHVPARKVPLQIPKSSLGQSWFATGHRFLQKNGRHRGRNIAPLKSSLSPP